MLEQLPTILNLLKRKVPVDSIYPFSKQCDEYVLLVLWSRGMMNDVMFKAGSSQVFNG